MLHGSCDKILRGWIHENKPFRAGEGIHLRYAKIQSMFAKFWGVRCLEPGLKKKVGRTLGDVDGQHGEEENIKKRKQNADSQRETLNQICDENGGIWKGAATEKKQRRMTQAYLAPVSLNARTIMLRLLQLFVSSLSGGSWSTICSAVNAIWLLLLMRKEMCLRCLHGGAH